MCLFQGWQFHWSLTLLYVFSKHHCFVEKILSIFWRKIIYNTAHIVNISLSQKNTKQNKLTVEHLIALRMDIIPIHFMYSIFYSNMLENSIINQLGTLLKLLCRWEWKISKSFQSQNLTKYILKTLITFIFKYSSGNEVILLDHLLFLLPNVSIHP